MTITVVQALPIAHMLVVTTPQPSASDIAVRAGLVSLQLPVKVAGVIENMSWYDHAGERLHIFGQGGGQRVSSQLTRDVGYDVPLLAQLMGAGGDEEAGYRTAEGSRGKGKGQER